MVGVSEGQERTGWEKRGARGRRRETRVQQTRERRQWGEDAGRNAAVQPK